MINRSPLPDAQPEPTKEQEEDLTRVAEPTQPGEPCTAANNEATPDEIERLREVAQIATDTLQTVDEWLGMASTRQAATDALWRLTRALGRAGYPVRVHDDLRWRGSIIRACEQAGIGLGEDHVTMRVRLDTDKPWQHASGPVLTPDKVRRLIREVQ
jgi:hypothetical protein